MKGALFLATALMLAGPAYAVPGWDEPSNSAFSAGVSSYSPPIAPPSAAERRQTVAEARLAAPNGSGNAIPNSPPTANPAGAGASSAATLQEHGEIPAGR